MFGLHVRRPAEGAHAGLGHPLRRLLWRRQLPVGLQRGEGLGRRPVPAAPLRGARRPLRGVPPETGACVLALACLLAILRRGHDALQAPPRHGSARGLVPAARGAGAARYRPAAAHAARDAAAADRVVPGHGHVLLARLRGRSLGRGGQLAPRADHVPVHEQCDQDVPGPVHLHPLRPGGHFHGHRRVGAALLHLLQPGTRRCSLGVRARGPLLHLRPAPPAEAARRAVPDLPQRHRPDRAREAGPRGALGPLLARASWPWRFHRLAGGRPGRRQRGAGAGPARAALAPGSQALGRGGGARGWPAATRLSLVVGSSSGA
mmetsp:Transcript_60323/g.186745  ORF Transcript_60323/g.186745 Transcript_60323/m.186745 type:complete len:319 (+) Transcript_60323:557-1513(+)